MSITSFLPKLVELVLEPALARWMIRVGDDPPPVALEDPGVQQKLAALGADPWPMAPRALGDRIASEITVWGPVVKASGAKVDG